LSYHGFLRVSVVNSSWSQARTRLGSEYLVTLRELR